MDFAVAAVVALLLLFQMVLLVWTHRGFASKPSVDQVQEIVARDLKKAMLKIEHEWTTCEAEFNSLYQKFNRMWGRWHRYSQEDRDIPTGRKALKLARESAGLTRSALQGILAQATITGKWPTSSRPPQDEPSSEQPPMSSETSSPSPSSGT